MMFTVKPNDAVIGATIEGLDASGTDRGSGVRQAAGGARPLRRAALSRTSIWTGDVRAFSERFGDIQGSRQPGQKRNARAGGRHPVEHPGERRSISARPMPGRTGTPTCPIAT